MIALRVFGVLVSLVALYLFYRDYKNRRSKTALTIGLLFVVSLASVSLTPDLFNAVFHFFTASRALYYRINVLLIFSVIFLSILQVRTLFTTEFHERSLIDVVTRHAVREFERQYDPDEIKPIQVVIPAYNEAESLADLLPAIPSSIEDRPVGVLVVSDGSDDGTFRTVREAGHPTVENLSNLGQGSALRVGFNLAARHGAEVIVSMDADGQHDPADLEGLVRPILRDEADFVLGSRREGKGPRPPFLRRLGIRFFNRLVSLLVGRRIRDCSNGVRAFRSELMQSIDLRERQYQATEFLIKALGKDVRFQEVPITVHRRRHGTSRKGPDLLYGWNFFKVLLETWWTRS